MTIKFEDQSKINIKSSQFYSDLNVQKILEKNVQKFTEIQRKYQNLQKIKKSKEEKKDFTQNEWKIDENSPQKSLKYQKQQQVIGVLQGNFISDFFVDIWDSIVGFFTSDLFISVMEGIGITILCIIGIIILIFLIKLCGFQAAGVLANSCAAIYQSLFYGGKIVAGGLFSCLQSIGALGIKIFSTKQGAIILGVSVGIGAIFTLISIFLL